MDFSTEQIARTNILEKENYGHWKVKMKAAIRGISAEAWTAVSCGWEPPVLRSEGEEIILKPEERWTQVEKRKASANALALSVIFNSVNTNQFQRIQNCESAKEAWDKLSKAYEGTSSVKRSRLDMLASRFETLTMRKTESIEEFSGKLSAIASEAHILGKRYKDKKLVKKLLRCLPAKFESKRTAMATALDTDNIEFEEVVGMLQAYEMEITPTYVGNSEAIADENKKDIQELKKEIESLSRKVNKILDSNDMRNRCTFNQGKGKEEEEKHRRRSNTKCHLCQGYGHDKGNCPSLKIKEIKCYECGGFGHIKAQCVKASRNEKSFIAESEESPSESESDEEVTDFVAFISNVGDDSSDSESDVSEKLKGDEDSDVDEDLNIEEQFAKLYDSWVILREEKSTLTEENLNLLQKVTGLEKSLTEEQEKNGGLEEVIAQLEKNLTSEQEKSKGLENMMAETNRKIEMMNIGTKNLDTILSYGRVGKSNHGLGYGEGNSMGKSQFVQGEVSGTAQFEQKQGKSVFSGSGYARNTGNHVPTGRSRVHHRQVWGHECYYCGKHGHIKRHCYMFKAKVRRLMSQERYCPHYNDSSYVFMRKDDIYEKDGEACSMGFAKTPTSEYFKSKKHEAELQDHEFLNELCQSRRGRLLNVHGSNVSLKFSSEGKNARLSNSIKKGEIVSAREKENYISAEYLFSR